MWQRKKLHSPPHHFLLQDADIYVRPPQEEDWEPWMQARSASRDFLSPWEPTWSEEALSRATFLRRVSRQNKEIQNEKACYFFTFQKESQALVGGINLSRVEKGVVSAATLSYWTAQNFVRQGYAYRGIGLALDFAFGTLGLHRMEAACLPHNEASKNLLLKLGFEQEGYARKYLKIAGSWQDHLLFGLLAEDWAASKIKT